MPRAIPEPIRREIVERQQAGESVASLQGRYGIAERTIRSLCRRVRERGEAGLATDYSQCGRQRRMAPEVWEAALALKREHRRWGAVLIQLELRERFPEQALPSERTLQRWFQAAGLAVERAIRTPQVGLRQRGRQPHEVWEVDAKEQIQLGDGSWSAILTVVDEASGALLAARAFPPALLGGSRAV